MWEFVIAAEVEAVGVANRIMEQRHSFCSNKY